VIVGLIGWACVVLWVLSLLRASRCDDWDKLAREVAEREKETSDV
jgi:hypothetical protein